MLRIVYDLQTLYTGHKGNTEHKRHIGYTGYTDFIWHKNTGYWIYKLPRI